MKIKLLVLAAAISPAMALVGQTTATFYNEGKMVVKGTDTANTVLYIKGDFVSGSSLDSTSTSQITLTKSRTVLTGDFKHDALLSGSTVFTGSTDDAIFEFRGTAKQNITTDGTTYATIPNKATSYINFPTLVINNKDSVILDPALAVQTVNLNLPMGTFSLNGVRIDSGNKARYYADNLASDATSNPDERSALAHLKVTGDIDYSNISADSIAERGFVRVIVPFDKSGSYTKTNSRFGSIVGMGIPFQKMKSDYFSWNYLMTPVGNAVGENGTTYNNYLGPNNNPVTSPTMDLQPGVGYIIGNELRGTDYADYAIDNTIIAYDKNASNFDARFKGEYVFDRAYFAGITNSNNFFKSYKDANKTEAYTEEKLNTSDVSVTLNKGFNYLANPYTSPLDISALLQNSSAKLADWGVQPGVSGSGRDIMNRVWVMSGSSKGSAKYNMLYPDRADITGSLMQVTVNTYLAKSSGGTYLNTVGSDATSRTIIPALQMFIVYAEKEVTITIPRSAQVMGEVPFIRSLDNSYDDFVFEVIDKKTETSDRASVVLRPKADIISDKEYTNVVKFNSSSQASTTKSTDLLTQTVSSQIYTQSDEGNPLTVKYLGYTPNVDAKVSTPLYLKPSNVDQDIVIKGYRLNTLTNFESIVLVDKLLGKEVYLTADTEYATTVKSTDSDDRFVLIFARGTDGIEDDIVNPSSKTINSYYASGVLTVNGFDESDFNSKLTVYDMQGRQVAHTTVNDYEVKVIADFAPGAYIVKVAGNNSSYVAKFLVK